MSRVLVICVLCFLLGSAGTWFMTRKTEIDAPSVAVGVNEVTTLQARIRALEAELAARPTAQGGPPQTPVRQLPALEGAVQASSEAPEPAQVRQESADATPIASANAIRWRVSAIEKFVPLTDDQRQRLSSKFVKEAQGAADTETLEDILGDDDARFYRQQVQAAFERVEREELDKEVVWLSRQLGMSPEQEQQVHTIFADIEREVSAHSGVGHAGGSSAQERVRSMIEENRRRRDLRAERLRSVLSKEQFEAFTRAEGESSSSDMEVFHDS